jgi:hypothetical protein
MYKIKAEEGKKVKITGELIENLFLAEVGRGN